MMEEAIASENERAKRRFSRCVGFRGRYVGRDCRPNRRPSGYRILPRRRKRRRASEFAGSAGTSFAVASLAVASCRQAFRLRAKKPAKNPARNSSRNAAGVSPGDDSRPPASPLERRPRPPLGRLALAAATCRSLGDRIGRIDQLASRGSQSPRGAGIEISDGHSALLFLADRRRQSRRSDPLAVGPLVEGRFEHLRRRIRRSAGRRQGFAGARPDASLSRPCLAGHHARLHACIAGSARASG